MGTRATVANRPRRIVTVMAAIALSVVAAACNDDGDGDDGDGAGPGAGATTAAGDPTSPAASRAPGSAPATTTVDTTDASDASSRSGGTLGDGYTITAETAEAADACFLQWHSVRTAAIDTFRYHVDDIEAVLALCAQADAAVDEDNRGAPNEPLPVFRLSEVIGQVLVASSNEMRTTRDRCSVADCTLGPDQIAGFLVLSRDADDPFSGQLESAPTVADIGGVVIQ